MRIVNETGLSLKSSHWKLHLKQDHEVSRGQGVDRAQHLEFKFTYVLTASESAQQG